MPHRYSLETRLPFGVLPRNMQHIWVGLAGNKLKLGHLIALITYRFAVNPGAVANNSDRFRLHKFYGVEFDLSFSGTASSFFRFQKDGENLDGFKRFVGVVG